MSINEQIVLVLWALQLAFSAGIAWMIVKQMKKDLSGLGGKVRGIQQDDQLLYLTIVCAFLLEGIPEEKHARYSRLADMFLAAAREKRL